MRTTHFDEPVMQVGLVRMERRDSLRHAGRHDAQRVEDGYAQYGERKRNQSHLRPDIGGAQGVVAQGVDHEDRHDYSHHQCSAVADEHPRCFAEHIVQKERDQRSGCRRCENCHLRVSCENE